MNRISLYLTLILALMASSAQLSAQDNDTEHKNSELEAKSDRFFKTLAANDYEKAYADLFSNSVLINSNATQVENLIRQTKVASELYGGISKCNLAKQKTMAELVHSQVYICQHEHSLTRWDIIYGETSNGWSLLNISFNDQISDF